MGSHAAKTSDSLIIVSSDPLIDMVSYALSNYGMTVDEIRELIALAAETGIAELEVQRGDNRVRIRRASFAAPQEVVVAPASYAAAPHQRWRRHQWPVKTG